LAGEGGFLALGGEDVGGVGDLPDWHICGIVLWP
jgi:hypothetical protein